MALVLRKIYDGYNYFFYEINGKLSSFNSYLSLKIDLMCIHYRLNLDDRSADFFLIANPPIPFFTILAGYVLMVKYGPKFMEGRKPLDLKFVMMFYNLLQVIFNTIIAVDVTKNTFLWHVTKWLKKIIKSLLFKAAYNILIKGSFNYECEPCEYSNTPRGLYFLKMTYYYFLLKILDLFDTVYWWTIIIVTMYQFFFYVIKIAFHHSEEKRCTFIVSALLPPFFYGIGNLCRSVNCKFHMCHWKEKKSIYFCINESNFSSF